MYFFTVLHTRFSKSARTWKMQMQRRTVSITFVSEPTRFNANCNKDANVEKVTPRVKKGAHRKGKVRETPVCIITRKRGDERETRRATRTRSGNPDSSDSGIYLIAGRRRGGGRGCITGFQSITTVGAAEEDKSPFLRSSLPLVSLRLIIVSSDYRRPLDALLTLPPRPGISRAPRRR